MTNRYHFVHLSTYVSYGYCNFDTFSQDKKTKIRERCKFTLRFMAANCMSVGYEH